ncbi:hypothetical protein [Streptomyces sp. NPDC054863]
MSQPPPPGPHQYQQQPYPGQQYAPYPPPPKKGMSTGAVVALVLGGLFLLLLLIIVIVAAAFSDGGDTSGKPKSPPVSVSNAPDAKPADRAPVAKAPAATSQADQFKAFVATSGTSTEKAAAKHVTRVQGADKKNDIMDVAEIHTDYTGGLLGPHGGDGKLLATAFAEWKSSKNGLVSVYDAKGELLANGNY